MVDTYNLYLFVIYSVIWNISIDYIAIICICVLRTFKFCSLGQVPWTTLVISLMGDRGRRSLQVQDQPCLCSEFQTSQGYIVILVKKKKKNTKTLASIDWAIFNQSIWCSIDCSPHAAQYFPTPLSSLGQAFIMGIQVDDSTTCWGKLIRWKHCASL